MEKKEFYSVKINCKLNFLIFNLLHIWCPGAASQRGVTALYLYSKFKGQGPGLVNVLWVEAR